MKTWKRKAAAGFVFGLVLAAAGPAATAAPDVVAEVGQRISVVDPATLAARAAAAVPAAAVAQQAVADAVPAPGDDEQSPKLSALTLAAVGVVAFVTLRRRRH